MRRRTITHARLAAEAVQKGGFRGRWFMVTPTYREDVDWQPNHIRELVRRLRDHFSRKGKKLHYQWVMELTKRGRPHYHVLIWVPKGMGLPHADRRRWWRQGLTRTEKARNPVGYIAKYASKTGLCDANGIEFKYPKGARICGGGGLEVDANVELRWWMHARWLREAVTADLGEGIHDVRRFGSFFVHPDTGMTWQSPWVFVRTDYRVGHFPELLFKLRDPEPTMQPWDIDRTLPGPDVPF